MRPVPRLVIAAFACLCMPSTLQAQDACGPAPYPSPLPAVDKVVDSAAVVALLAHGTGAAREFTILAEPDAPARILPVDGGIATTGAVGDPLLDSLATHLRKQPGRVFAWAVRLHAVGGDAPSVRIDRSTWCPPRLIPDNSRRSIRVSTVTRQSAGMPRSPRPRLETVDLQLVISATGNVARVARIGGSAPTRGELEDQLVPIALERRYNPARLDGIAVVSADTSRFPGRP
jgi:hypothetical protein